MNARPEAAPLAAAAAAAPGNGDWLARVPATQRAAIAAASETIDVAAGDLVVRQGEPPDALFLIDSGRLSVLSRGKDGREHQLAELSAGEFAGEMGFLDGAPRSASLRAMVPTRLTRISAEALARQEGGDGALAALRGALAAAVVGRMRAHNERYVGALQREIASLKERDQFGYFYLYTLATMAIGTIVHVIVAKGVFDLDTYTYRFSWQFLTVLLIPMAIVIWRMKIPVADLGITRRGLKRSVLEGLYMSVILLALLSLLMVTLVATGLNAPPTFAFNAQGTLAYALHSFLQELLARGFLQSSFQRFLNDRRGVKSVVLASLMFGMFHINYGPSAVALTTVGGFVFGAIYLRHKNLAGVTILHVTGGVAAYMLNLM
ncbi:MAG: hypothetical protein AcusKO_13270 [Acuticoccus sp.]